MNLPLEEQYLLLAAYEHSELWEVVSTLAEVARMRLGDYDLARRLTRKYMDSGWVELARDVHRPSGHIDLIPIADQTARSFIANDQSWAMPSEPWPTPDVESPPLLVLTDEGRRSIAAGAAADAFARIGKPRGES